MLIDLKRFICTTICGVIAAFLIVLMGNIYAGILIGVFLVIFAWYVSKAKENTYIVLFLIAFFAFLMGHVIVKELLHDDRAYYSVAIPQTVDNYTYIVLTISLLSIFVGYEFAKIPIRGSHNGCVKEYNYRAIKRVEFLTKNLLYVSLACLIAVNAESIIYVQTVGYLSSYLSKTSVLPGFISGIATMVPMIFALYLATIPEKQDAKWPIIFYVIAMGMNLFAGKRYEAVSAVLLLVLYASYRNKIDEDKWITKKHVLFLIVMLPVAVIMLTLMASWRAGSTDTDVGASLLIDFMSGVGNSSQLISYEKMYHSELASRNALFSFGNVWRSLSGNAIAQFMGFSQSYGTQTVENALYGHSLSAAIMYKINPRRMLEGGGLGSCYIAELMCDFSYFGVVLGNIVIGIIIQKLNRLDRGRFVTNFLMIFMATTLFRLPRDSFDYFFYQFLGIKNIILLVLVYLTYKKKESFDEAPISYEEKT